jgi:FlaG/FlaF family flagellin (archaellin)
MEHIGRNFRAISPVLAVLMMIAVAIAGSLVVYAWVMGYIDLSQGRAGEAITIPSIANDPADADLLVYVQNIGEESVQLDENECLYVDGILAPCTISGVTVSDTLATLDKGETAMLRYSGGAAHPDEKVKVKVTTLRGTSAEKYAYPAGNLQPVSGPSFDHFEFDTIESPQNSGVSFTATISAIDENGDLFTGYSGVNSLVHSSLMISPSMTGNFTHGIWTGNVTLTGSATSTAITTVAQSNPSWTGTSNLFNVIVWVNYHLEEWSQKYGGTEYDEAYSLIVTPDGGYAIAGCTYSFGAGGNDFWLIKTNSTGHMEWNRTYGGPANDVAYSLVVTEDEGYALAGFTFGGLWLVKTDEFGNMEWNNTYSGVGTGSRCSLVNASDGGYAIVGGQLFVKTDEFGNMERSQTYNRLCNSLITTSDGGYAIAGSTYFGNSTEGDFCLIKLDEFCNTEWERIYRKTDRDLAYSLVATSDGGYAIAGETNYHELSDFWLVKTNSTGHMEWNQTYEGEWPDIAYSLIVTSDGGYAMAGRTGSFAFTHVDFWLIKTDEFGNMEWNQTYGGLGYDIAYSLVEIPDDGYALAGVFNSEVTDMNRDFWLIKTY